MKEQELFPNLPATKEETAPAVTREDALLSTVLASGNIEVLERYIALRKSEEERQARIAFEEAFSRMRRELPAVAKRKDNGATKSKYAPLEELQRACDPIIYQHGFSYAWREEAIPEGKRVILDIFGYGHSKSNFFDCPKIPGNNAQNAIQVAGAMSTYGRRYTFISGFGIIVEGEDADGQITDDGEILSFDLKAMLEERDSSGKFILSPEAHEAITKELAKPEPSITRLKHFYKLGKEKIRKVKP